MVSDLKSITRWMVTHSRIVLVHQALKRLTKTEIHTFCRLSKTLTWRHYTNLSSHHWLPPYDPLQNKKLNTLTFHIFSFYPEIYCRCLLDPWRNVCIPISKLWEQRHLIQVSPFTLSFSDSYIYILGTFQSPILYSIPLFLFRHIFKFASLAVLWEHLRDSWADGFSWW